MAKTDLTVIIPVHTVEGDTITWLEKAIQSIENQNIKPDSLFIIVSDNKKVLDEVNKLKLGSIREEDKSNN